MAAHPLDDLPMHWAFGERAPQGLVAALAALALLMAAGTVWLIGTRARSELQVVPQAAPAQPADTTPANVEVPRAVEPAPTTTPTPTPTPAATTATGVAAPVELRTECPAPLRVHFAFGSAVPVPAEPAVDTTAIVEWAQAHPRAKIVVEGHADRTGTDQSNVLLSYARARAVATWLERRGLPAQRMQLTAAGSHALLDGVAPGAQAQRRVVVQVSDSENCQTTAN